MSLESNGYSMRIFGSEGREKYVLRFKGRVVGRGDLRHAVAKSARERVNQFDRKNTVVSAEARLRKFAFNSRLTGT